MNISFFSFDVNSILINVTTLSNYLQLIIYYIIWNTKFVRPQCFKRKIIIWFVMSITVCLNHSHSLCGFDNRNLCYKDIPDSISNRGIPTAIEKYPHTVSLISVFYLYVRSNLSWRVFCEVTFVLMVADSDLKIIMKMEFIIFLQCKILSGCYICEIKIKYWWLITRFK